MAPIPSIASSVSCARSALLLSCAPIKALNPPTASKTFDAFKAKSYGLAACHQFQRLRSFQTRSSNPVRSFSNMRPQSSARNAESPTRRNFRTKASGETPASETGGSEGSASISEPRSPSLWAKLGQSFNLQGVTAVASVAVSNPSLAVPHVSVPDIRWIDWKALHAAEFKAVVFDKDNTLTLPYEMQMENGLVASLDVCRKTFGSKGIAILSNSAGLKQYDPDGSLAAAMEQALGVPVILHTEKKPGGGAAELETHFGCRADEMVMVGDRCLTDIVFGNRNGLLTVLTAPLSPGEDPLVVRQARKFEDVLVTTLHRRGVQAPLQAKFSSSYSFVLPPACW